MEGSPNLTCVLIYINNHLISWITTHAHLSIRLFTPIYPSHVAFSSPFILSPASIKLVTILFTRLAFSNCFRIWYNLIFKFYLIYLSVPIILTNIKHFFRIWIILKLFHKFPSLTLCSRIFFLLVSKFYTTHYWSRIFFFGTLMPINYRKAGSQMTSQTTYSIIEVGGTMFSICSTKEFSKRWGC
jgi:hypothetical protein